MTGPIACPTCGRINDQHDGRPGARPKPGDVALCWKCGGIALYTESGQRLPTAKEAAEIGADPEVQRARSTIRAAAVPSQAIDVLWGSS